MSRNIVKEYIDFNRKELLEYFDLVFGGKPLKGLPNKMVDTYIDLRYYNLYNDNNVTLINDIVNTVKDKAFDYIKEQKIKLDEVQNEVFNALWILKYFLCFEKAINDKRISKLLMKLEKKVNDRNNKVDLTKMKIFPMIKENQKKKDRFLRGCYCKDFEVSIKTTNLKGVFYTDLISHVKIPELFSAMAVKKVYETGTVNEDKLLVLYTMVSLQVLNDINFFNYSHKYLVSFDLNMFTKKIKCKQLFKIIDLDFLKDRMIIRVTYDEFMENKDVLYEYIRSGFKFAVIIDEEFKGNVQLLEVFEYVILNGKLEKMTKLKKIDNVVIMDLLGV